jgi:hypothetical protein
MAQGLAVVGMVPPDGQIEVEIRLQAPVRLRAADGRSRAQAAGRRDDQALAALVPV